MNSKAECVHKDTGLLNLKTFFLIRSKEDAEQLLQVINHGSLDILLNTGGLLILEGLVCFFFFFNLLREGVFSKTYVTLLEHGESVFVYG